MADGDSQAICDSQASLRWPEGLFPLPLFADINTLILKVLRVTQQSTAESNDTIHGP